MNRAHVAGWVIGLTLMACHPPAAKADQPEARAAAPVAAVAGGPAAADAPVAAPAEPVTAPAGPATADSNVYSAAALYNLANSYARAGKPGLAVLNYERASLLAPNDPDIDANRHYVREALHLPPDSRNGVARAATTIGPTLLSWMGVIGVIIIGASLLARRRYPRYRWMHRSALACGAALVGLTVANAVVLWPTLHEAVVITAATQVRVAPVPMGDPLFVLPEAETVRMTAEHEDYVLVQTKAGRTGWVSRANLAPVVPKNSRPAARGDSPE
jgi:hypothetical protein